MCTHIYIYREIDRYIHIYFPVAILAQVLAQFASCPSWMTQSPCNGGNVRCRGRTHGLLAMLTALLRLASATNPFIQVQLHEDSPEWLKKMKRVIYFTRVHVPLKEAEVSMAAYSAYRGYMCKVRYSPDAQEYDDDISGFTYHQPSPRVH